jgi:hypothetical protein
MTSGLGCRWVQCCRAPSETESYSLSPIASPRFVDRFGDHLPNYRRHLIERYLAVAPGLSRQTGAHRHLTVMQGDAHVWNCFLPHDGGDDDDVRLFDIDMLDVFAEFETNLRRERQLEGIALAKTRGVYKGRKAALTPPKSGVCDMRRGWDLPRLHAGSASAVPAFTVPLGDRPKPGGRTKPEVIAALNIPHRLGLHPLGYPAEYPAGPPRFRTVSPGKGVPNLF